MLEWLNENLGASQVIAAFILGSSAIVTIWKKEIKVSAKNIWKNKYKLSPRNIKWTTKKLFNAAKEKRVRAEYIDLTTQTRNAIGELLILVRRLAETVQTLITEQKPQDSELTERINRLVEQAQECNKGGNFTAMYQEIADIDNMQREILDKDKKWKGTKHYPRGKTKL